MCLGQRTPDSILCPTILTSPCFQILTLLRKKKKAALQMQSWDLRKKPEPEHWFPHNESVSGFHAHLHMLCGYNQANLLQASKHLWTFLALVILFSTPACLQSCPASSPNAPTSELCHRLLQGQPQEPASKQTGAPPHLGKHNNQHCLVLRALNKNSHWCWLNK